MSEFACTAAMACELVAGVLPHDLIVDHGLAASGVFQMHAEHREGNGPRSFYYYSDQVPNSDIAGTRTLLGDEQSLRWKEKLEETDTMRIQDRLACFEARAWRALHEVLKVGRARGISRGRSRHRLPAACKAIRSRPFRRPRRRE